MRMETNTERYEGFEQIFDGVQECPVDTEYTLPDYCADIQKILKCIVTPEVTSVSAAGDSLTIDGCASMHVLYLDAKGGCVRGFDTKKEFTCLVRLRAQAENVTAEAEPFVQHMTCRAMNARRVDLHITLGLSVRAYAVRQLEIADCISDDRVETKCEEYDVTRAVGCVMHAFVLEQNAELPNGKSPIETVLRCSVRYQIDTVQPQEGGYHGKGVCGNLIPHVFRYRHAGALFVHIAVYADSGVRRRGGRLYHTNLRAWRRMHRTAA